MTPHPHRSAAHTPAAVPLERQCDSLLYVYLSLQFGELYHIPKSTASVGVELGLKVPDDVSVLGIGDDPFLCENQSIPISSVRQDLAHGAYEGAALLQRLINGEAEPKNPILIQPTGLTARASTDTLANPDPFIRAALMYINRHLGESFGTPQIASAIGLPRHKLDHLFAEKLGHSVGSEIHSRRMSRAKHMLSDTSTPIKDIASACGFCNIAHFSNAFRKATDLSPRAWRQSAAT